MNTSCRYVGVKYFNVPERCNQRRIFLDRWDVYDEDCFLFVLMGCVTFIRGLRFRNSSQVELIRYSVRVGVSIFVAVYRSNCRFRILCATLEANVRVCVTFGATVFPMVLVLRMKAIAVARGFGNRFILSNFWRQDGVRVDQGATIFAMSYRFAICPTVGDKLGSFGVGRSVRSFPVNQCNGFACMYSCQVMVN